MKNQTLRFGSVCSGIEAASVAWHPLGWKAAWLSEIEPFPSAVLAHHYPDVPNLGDMTALPEKIRSRDIEAPDIFCGGTPCQAFSVAGKRQSLDDARGNLSLTFCEIANAIDDIRHTDGQQPAIIFWENVPGVLNTKDNAFGCFLGELAGEDCALEPPGGKWSNAGCVFGPQRTIAWRILDAQFFGVAQRRRRVFVVASARDGFDPTAVLFEFDGLRRDTPPRREAGQSTAHDVAPSLTASGRDTERIGETRGQDPVVAVPAEGCWWDGGQVSQTLDAVLAKGQTMPEKNRFPAVLQPVCVTGEITHTLRAEGFDASEDGTGRGQPIVAAMRESGHGFWMEDEIAGTLRAEGENRPSRPSNVIAVPLRGRDGGATAELGGDVSNCLRASSVGGDKPHALAPVAWSEELTPSIDVAGTIQYGGQGGRHDGVMQMDMQVRRLTPVECERLQGFPGNYTNIPWTEYQRIQKRAAKEGVSFEAELRKRGKVLRGQDLPACPDGPRYKALGNSWAVPNVRWIGERIDNALRGNA